MNRILFGSIALLFAVTAGAQSATSSDPFDLSASQSKVKELGVPTTSTVDALEAKARELYTAGNCAAAIPALEDFARKANWLSNLIAAGLDPYYGASYDDRKGYSYAKLQPLIPLEKKSNGYKAKRNIAFIMEAECHLKLGNKEKAIPLLVRALDLLSIDEEETWVKARKLLYTAIEVQ